MLILLSGCSGSEFTSVTVSLSPDPIELPLEAQTSSRVFAVGLTRAPSELTSARLRVDACIEIGLAGRPCVVDRVEAPSPFEQPDGWMNIVREDNAVLPYASIDAKRFALYEGETLKSFSKSLLDDEDEPIGGLEYSIRFDRADLLRQTAGIAAPVLHINWDVSVTAMLRDSIDDEEGLDPRLLQGDFIELELIEREPRFNAWELLGADPTAVDDDEESADDA